MVRLKIAEAFTEGRGDAMRGEGGFTGRFIRSPISLQTLRASRSDDFSPGRLAAVSYPGTFTGIVVTE
jgi:hypothetical protein